MSGKVIVGVDASRSRSGGGIAHIKGIFSSFDPRELGIKRFIYGLSKNYIKN